MITGQLKILDIKHVDKVKDGSKHSLTVIGSRARGLAVGEDVHIIYKERNSAGLCANCLNAETCGEQSNNKRCSKYTNLFGVTTITKVEHVDLLHSEPYERDIWAQDEGFKDFQYADDWYMSRYGEEWCFTPVTVITWDKGQIAKKWVKDVKKARANK